MSTEGNHDNWQLGYISISVVTIYVKISLSKKSEGGQLWGIKKYNLGKGEEERNKLKFQQRKGLHVDFSAFLCLTQHYWIIWCSSNSIEFLQNSDNIVIGTGTLLCFNSVSAQGYETKILAPGEFPSFDPPDYWWQASDASCAFQIYIDIAIISMQTGRGVLQSNIQVLECGSSFAGIPLQTIAFFYGSLQSLQQQQIFTAFW